MYFLVNHYQVIIRLMFSLYVTKMNIHIDINGDNGDISKLTPGLLDMMNYLYSYLDNDWTIKKRKSSYILAKDNHKMFVSESIRFANSSPTMSSSSTKINHHSSENHDTTHNKTKYIFYFLYNVLNNGWTIKKTRQEEYTFIKNHEGKKEIFSNKYLHTFMKDNFNFQLIK